MNGHFLLGDIHPLKYFFTFAVCLGLVFFFISPAENVHWALGLMQWQLQALIPVTLLITTHLLLARLSWFQKLGHWYRLLISGAIGSALTTPFALLVEIWVVNEPWPTNLSTGLVEEWAGMGIPVILSWLLMNAPILMGFEYRKQVRVSGQQSNAGVDRDNSTAEGTGILALAKVTDPEQILALSSELHYLDVILKDEHQLVLYSLSNAIAELPEQLGIQVHRSHWVAYSAVASFKKTGRQGVLLLTNGREIPVSRAKMSVVKATLSDLAIK